uniref:Putative tick kunitz 87 n=1 Tax=Amblyomma triste TaxID=251400 RepID=A0A023G3R8_AMBTT
MKLTFLVFFVYLYGCEWLPSMAEPSYKRKKEDCLKRLKVGKHCDKRGERQKWFYNTTSKTCEEFTYLGCKGNANRFPSQEACLLLCKSEKIDDIRSTAEQEPSCEEYDGAEDTSLPTDLCSLTAEKGGRCPGKKPGIRWFYTRQNKTCSPFYYCGCGGNENNFPEEDVCIQTCDPQMYDYEEYEKNLENTETSES